MSQNTLNLKFKYHAKFNETMAKSLNFNSESAINELLQNSEDAHAKHIKIILDTDNRLHFIDDGDGMTTDTLVNHYFTYGRDAVKEGDNETIGCKGCGGKCATLYFLDVNNNNSYVEILTKTKNGQCLYAKYNAAKIIESRVYDTIVKDGTWIRITNPVNVDDLDDVVKTKISLYHQPVMEERGVTITYGRYLQDEGYVLPNEDPMHFKDVSKDKIQYKKWNLPMEDGTVEEVEAFMVDCRGLQDNPETWTEMEKKWGGVNTTECTGLYVQQTGNCYITLAQSSKTFGKNWQVGANGLRALLRGSSKFLETMGKNIKKTSEIQPFDKKYPVVAEWFSEQIQKHISKQEEIEEMNEKLAERVNNIHGTYVFPYCCHVVQGGSSPYLNFDYLDNTIDIAVNIENSTYFAHRDNCSTSSRMAKQIHRRVSDVLTVISCGKNANKVPTKQKLNWMTRAGNKLIEKDIANVK